MTRSQQLNALEAELLAALTAKHRALARSDTRKFKQALDQLKRVRTAILDVGPEKQEG